jgi:hypothetical protein
MKQLDTQFKGRASQKGWMFKQLVRSSRFAIYEKTSESTVTYEVIEIRVKKATSAIFPDGRMVDYPEQELYPRDEDFGLYGWTYGSKDTAETKFLLLCYNFPEFNGIHHIVSAPHNRGTQPV